MFALVDCSPHSFSDIAAGAIFVIVAIVIGTAVGQRASQREYPKSLLGGLAAGLLGPLVLMGLMVLVLGWLYPTSPVIPRCGTTPEIQIYTYTGLLIATVAMSVSFLIPWWKNRR